MIVLPNMGLVKWDSINDFFSHEQLAANFQSLDEHNHTAGKGSQIPYGGLAEQSVGSENLREEIFDASSLSNESIETAKIQNGAITASKVATGAKELFPQLANAGSHKMAVGVTAEIGAGSTLEVTHGLGAEPSVVIPAILKSGAVTFDIPVVSSKTSTKFTLRNGSAGSYVVMWFAIT